MSQTCQTDVVVTVPDVAVLVFCATAGRRANATSAKPFPFDTVEGTFAMGCFTTEPLKVETVIVELLLTNPKRFY